jgi:hypothetical protein
MGDGRLTGCGFMAAGFPVFLDMESINFLFI